MYVDGPVRQMKAETSARRSEQRELQWERLQGACLDGQQVAQAELPEPPLMMQQLLASAAALGVPLVRCVGEADQEMAIACGACCAAGQPCFIYGRDSDFYLLRGSRYIPFGEIDFEDPAEGSADVLAASATVWTPELLEELTSLPFNRLVEWAVLQGLLPLTTLESLPRHLYQILI
jgi:hypothetical protein